MSVTIYKCPNCDGGLIFDPESQQFKCEYCVSNFTQRELENLSGGASDKAAVEEKVKVSENETSQEDLRTALYSCPTCGAEVATDETTAATYCYYCHNPVVLSSRLTGSLKPNKVVPFKIGKEQAIEELLKWAKKKWFIPKAFFSKSQIEKVTGVYFPYWIIDGRTHGMMTANATKVRSWRSGNTQYTETSHYTVVREGDMDFNELVKNALNKENSNLVNGVHPYNFSEAKDYSSTYLSGFQAEKRNIEKTEYENEVYQDLTGYSRSLLTGSITGYSAITSSDLNVSNVECLWNYTLLPAWVLTYKGNNGKMYYYTMNGQTGKVNGNLPVNFKKLFLFFGGISFLLFAILMLGGYFL